MASRKIQSTKNYKLFGRSDENRPLDLKKHKKLKESMEKYGFLACFPIVCYRNDKGNLVIKDGQHRLTIAESLDLPVFWVEEEVDFDVATINCTAKIWGPMDYVLKYIANGVESYRVGLEFSERHRLPIGVSFALLSGTTTFTNITDAFQGGEFKVKDEEWANLVARIYGAITSLSSELRTSRFTEACMAVCRVDGFDPDRLIHGAQKCREKLVPYATREAYLVMLEEVYNFNRHTKNTSPLKFLATQAMDSRNATTKSKKEKQNKKPNDNGQSESGAA